jgi:hypothetical protein
MFGSISGPSAAWAFECRIEVEAQLAQDAKVRPQAGSNDELIDVDGLIDRFAMCDDSPTFR